MRNKNFLFQPIGQISVRLVLFVPKLVWMKSLNSDQFGYRKHGRADSFKTFTNIFELVDFLMAVL